MTTVIARDISIHHFDRPQYGMAVFRREIKLGITLSIHDRNFEGCDLRPLERLAIGILEIVSADEDLLNALTCNVLDKGKVSEVLFPAQETASDAQSHGQAFSVWIDR